MQESPHEREGIDDTYFKALTGLVGLVACSYVAVELVTPFPFILNQPPLINWLLIVTASTGWGGLVYACWSRSGRITDTALAFVLALGVLGGAITFLALAAVQPVPPERLAWAIVILVGTWIMNGLGIVWIVHKVRRIRAASNTDAGDAAR